jgi:hypothetical protein
MFLVPIYPSEMIFSRLHSRGREPFSFSNEGTPRGKSEIGAISISTFASFTPAKF